MENSPSTARPILFAKTEEIRTRLPSASVRPNQKDSKLLPPRSRLPTFRGNSTLNESQISISGAATSVVDFSMAAAVSVKTDIENIPPKKSKRKSEDHLPGNPEPKRFRQEPRVTNLKQKAARRSVSNALKISRKKVLTTKSNLCRTAPVPPKPAPVVRKPLVQSRVNTGRNAANKSATAAPSRNRAVAAPVPRTAPRKVAQSAPRSANSSVNSSISSRGSGEGVGTKKKSKRAPWDLRGQLDDLKGELAASKKKEDVMDNILSRLKALESEKNIIAVEKTALSSDLSGIQQRLQDTELAKRNVEMDLRNKELEKQDLARQNRSLQGNLDELDLQCRQLRRDNLANDETIHKQTKSIDELKEENARLAKSLREYKALSERLEAELNEKEVERRQLLNDVQELKGNIRVFCRVRPMLAKEKVEHGEMEHIAFSGGKKGKSLNITNDASKSLPFTFDRVFEPGASQVDVFTDVAQLVQSALDGYNVCIFAYGQTGAGKTYTMEGPDQPDPEHDGIIPRSMRLIFKQCEELKKFGWNYKLAVQQVEIYRETLQDLLETKNDPNLKLEIKTVAKKNKLNGVWVKNLTSHPVSNFAEIRKLLARAQQKRATASTNANERSSRSHSVFILRIEASNEATGEEVESSLNLIDLAGSERIGETGSSGTRLKEAQKINGSLSELSNVISALANKDKHVPFRNSKLTFLLMDCLGGNSKTLMLVNVNPVRRATGETINTLRFATTVNKCNIGTAQKVIKF